MKKSTEKSKVKKVKKLPVKSLRRVNSITAYLSTENKKYIVAEAKKQETTCSSIINNIITESRM